MGRAIGRSAQVPSRREGDAGAGGGGHQRRPRHGGFTLIEAVVALAILSAGLVMIQRIEGGSARIRSGAAQRVAALALAEALLAETRAFASPTRSGITESGLVWQVGLSPHGDAGLYHLSVIVTPQGGPPVRLDTLVRTGQ